MKAKDVKLNKFYLNKTSNNHPLFVVEKSKDGKEVRGYSFTHDLNGCILPEKTNSKDKRPSYMKLELKTFKTKKLKHEMTNTFLVDKNIEYINLHR